MLAVQHQQVAGENADVKQHAHGHCEQHQIESVGRRRDDRRDNENRQDRVAAVAQHEAGAEYPQQLEEERQNRQFEHQRDSQYHVDEKVEIAADRNDGLDAVAQSDTQQKSDGVAEQDEVGEQTAGDKQAGRSEDK